MALTFARYLPHDGADLHLVPGLVGPRLDQRLLLTYDGGAEKRGDQRDASTSLTFTANFDGAPTGHGILLNPTTGVLGFPGPNPLPGLRSFVVTATLTDSGNTFTVRLRVHVHSGIDQVWLAPSPLTVRRGARNMRLTVLARFDDMVIGDVTNWGSNIVVPPGDLRPYAVFRVDGPPFLRWSAGAGPTTVDGRSGLLSATANGGSTVVSVQAGDPAAAKAASASVDCGPPWSTPVRLREVGNRSTFPSIPERTNVLFLPDGFVRGEQPAFERIVVGIVQLLRDDPHTRPFDLINDDVNYFMAWVESPRPGTTVLNEVHHTNLGVPRDDEGTEIPLPLDLPVDDLFRKPWTLENLIDLVGLPAPGDATLTLNTALTNWQARFGPFIDANRVTRGVQDGKPRNLFPDWLALADRVLCDDIDSAFHMAFGDHPTLSVREEARSLTPDRRRYFSDDFELFLDNLQLPDGTTPQRWSIGKPDQANVVIICRSQREGGANLRRRDAPPTDARLIGVSLGVNAAHDLLTVVPAPNVLVGPDGIPAAPAEPTPEWLVVAHELAHSWSLLDEYKENDALDDAKVASIARAGNVQPRSELLGPGAGPLTTAHLKWRWPRITAAARLVGPPEPEAEDGSVATPVTAHHYRLTVRAGHARGFTRGDIVRLRTRPLLTSGAPSAYLRVGEVDAARDMLTLEAPRAEDTPPDITRFGSPASADAIVFRPRREPDPDPVTGGFGADLGLVSPFVLKWIDDHHNPLNAAAGKSAASRKWAEEGIDPADPTPARNFPGRHVPAPHIGPRLSSWIVGLYEEGAAVPEGVYRPTGICLMRSRFIERVAKDPATGAEVLDTRKDQAYQFCPVCRYVMVDIVDPTKHGVIDEDYDRRYVR